MTEAIEYPWYRLTTGDDLAQGDVLESCPVMFPKMFPKEVIGPPAIEWVQRDVVVLSQSCDMVQGREKVVEVLLSAAYFRSELEDPHLKSNRGLEDARRGYLPGIHLLAACDIADMKEELRIVNFRRLFSLPVPFVRRHAASLGPRLCLLPPYREHLAQAFARYFMRVGLPSDIPSFR